jgi:hypothetical protein
VSGFIWLGIIQRLVAVNVECVFGFYEISWLDEEVPYSAGYSC